MRVSFLVLLACLCLSAVSAGKRQKENVEQSSYVNKDGYDVQAEKKTVVTEDTETKVIKTGDVVEEEEITKIRTSTNGKRKGKRKKEGSEKVWKSCDELLVSEKAECVPATATQKCSWSILSEETCQYECRCEEEKIEVVEEVYEEAEGSAGAQKKVRKVKKAGERKKKRPAGGRECNGKKKLSFSNCLLKMRGLIAWGEDTATIDADFAQLTA